LDAEISEVENDPLDLDQELASLQSDEETTSKRDQKGKNKQN